MASASCSLNEIQTDGKLGCVLSSWSSHSVTLKNLIAAYFRILCKYSTPLNELVKCNFVLVTAPVVPCGDCGPPQWMTIHQDNRGKWKVTAFIIMHPWCIIACMHSMTTFKVDQVNVIGGSPHSIKHVNSCSKMWS